MQKTITLFITIVTLTFVLCACGTPAPAPEEVSWNLYTYNPRAHSFTKEMIQFGEDVKAMSNGRFNIRVFGVDEITYKGMEFLRLVKDKAVDAAQVVAPYIAGDEPIVAGPGLPFLSPVRTYQATFMLVDAIGEETDAALAKWNAKVMARWTYPEQNIWLASPANSLDALKELKLRAPGPDQACMLNHLGATGVTMSSGEVYTALQRKVIEGVYTSTTNVVSLKWDEVCKQGWRTQSEYPVDRLMVRNDRWDALSPEFKMILMDASAELAKRMQSYSTGEKLAGEIAELKRRGMEFREVSTSEYEQMAEMVKPCWYIWAKSIDNGEVLLQKMAEAVGRKL